MGFSVQIQADYGSESLQNVHPDGRLLGGNAVFAFLMGLLNYCTLTDDQKAEAPELAWYRRLEQSASEPICSACRAFLDCMWGNGGDFNEYYNDEFEFYKKRHSGAPPEPTEEQFQFMVQEAPKHWKPIEEVISGVRFLLNTFKSKSLDQLGGFYEPENTIPDFEALLANLELLAKRGNKVVRLNFC